jgi:hypothetical protein
MEFRRIGIVMIAPVMAAIIGCSAKPIPPDRGYSERLCISPADWPRVMSLMKAFGATHGMAFHGEVEPFAKDVPGARAQGQMNFALIRGPSEIGRDELDIWLTSDPFTPSEGHFNVTTRRKTTPEQAALARKFLVELQTLTCSRR